jgi:hypothetical protein
MAIQVQERLIGRMFTAEVLQRVKTLAGSAQ